MANVIFCFFPHPESSWVISAVLFLVPAESKQNRQPVGYAHMLFGSAVHWLGSYSAAFPGVLFRALSGSTQNLGFAGFARTALDTFGHDQVNRHMVFFPTRG